MPGLLSVKRRRAGSLCSSVEVHHRMDEGDTKPDLVRSPHKTKVLRQLKHGGIRKTGSSAASEVEPARHSDDGHLGPGFREVHIPHTQVAQCEKCIVDSFEERPSYGRAE